jgi:hypothetical protein
MFLSMACIISSLFTFLTTVNGFSWETFNTTLGAIIILSILLSIDYFINKRTIRFLHKQNILPLSRKDKITLKVDKDIPVSKDNKKEEISQ